MALFAHAHFAFELQSSVKGNTIDSSKLATAYLLRYDRGAIGIEPPVFGPFSNRKSFQILPCDLARLLNLPGFQVPAFGRSITSLRGMTVMLAGIFSGLRPLSAWSFIEHQSHTPTSATLDHSRLLGFPCSAAKTKNFFDTPLHVRGHCHLICPANSPGRILSA